ncbi:flavodoxin [uncultured Methanobrevibacter sp.]|uniref:flavodoxin family protein n=1 Tax=uncultured Methanobrevibacter sp. TaxID=253161 RepID=UPI0025DB1D9A|nr:flavodoxin [uncultured Methanobrevibacter sp.]
MKSIIIYYSNNGKTKIVAETLAKKLNTDIIGIEDKKERHGLRNKLKSSFDALTEKKTEISPNKIDLTEYNTVYFGTPVWYGKPTPAIMSIIDKSNLKDKNVVLFATMKGASAISTLKKMEEKIEPRGGRVIEKFSIKTKRKSKEKIIRDSEVISKILDLSI